MYTYTVCVVISRYYTLHQGAIKESWNSISVFYTHDRDGVLRVFSNFRFLSCRSPIGTARHLFSRSVNGTSSGSSTSWINARIGRAELLVMSVLQDTVSSLDEVAPFPRWLTIANHGCIVFFSSRDKGCCSFGGAFSSKESFWKETERRFYFIDEFVSDVSKCYRFNFI